MGILNINIISGVMMTGICVCVWWWPIYNGAGFHLGCSRPLHMIIMLLLLHCVFECVYGVLVVGLFAVGVGAACRC